MRTLPDIWAVDGHRATQARLAPAFELLLTKLTRITDGDGHQWHKCLRASCLVYFV